MSAASTSPAGDHNNDNELEAIKQKKMAELQKIAAERQALSSITQPIHLNDSSFSSETSKYPLMLVDFWAPWCGPCRMVGPVIDQLAKEYAGKVVFGKVNVDENPIISNTFGIASIPTMMIFKNGKAVDVIIGAMPKGQIEVKLKQQFDGSASSQSTMYG